MSAPPVLRPCPLCGAVSPVSDHEVRVWCVAWQADYIRGVDGDRLTRETIDEMAMRTAMAEVRARRDGAVERAQV